MSTNNAQTPNNRKNPKNARNNTKNTTNNSSHPKKKKRRLKLRVGRLAAMLLIFIVLIAAIIFGIVKLFSSSNTDSTVAADADSALVQDEEEISDEEKAAKEAEEKAKEEAANTKLEEIKTAEVGTTPDLTDLDDEQLKTLFFDSAITDDQVANMVATNVYVEDQDFITPEDLRYIRVLYKDFNNEDKIGELIVNQKIAGDVENVFYELWENGYQIENMILPDNYNGDDNVSMINDNTSAFSFRLCDGAGLVIHEHSLGLSIDINPAYNPQVIENEGVELVFPYTAEEYADRTNVQDHMITHDDLAYQIFTKYGFTWGGDWDVRCDYMHFEKDYDSSLYEVVDPDYSYSYSYNYTTEVE